MIEEFELNQQIMSNNTTNHLYETNNYSIISKYSAIRGGYFNDDLLKEFVESYLDVKSWRRSPLVNRGYAARLLAMDWILGRSIVSEALDCIIVLGAGFDTTPFRYTQCCWIEIDLPQVVEVKLKFLNDKKMFDNSSLLTIEDGSVYSSLSNNYHLIACDLEDFNKLASCLKLVLNLLDKSRKKKFAIVNEVCLCYLELKSIEVILALIIDTLHDFALRIHYISYEQVKPDQNSQFSEVMLDHFKSLGHPLKYFPTSSQIRQLFCNLLKFNHVTVISMYQMYHNALLANVLGTEAFQEEPFDEFEEMDLYLSHYALVTGVLILADPFMDYHNNSNLLSSPDESKLSSRLEEFNLNESPAAVSLIPSDIHRFGHATCSIDTPSRSFIVTGGFGTCYYSGEANDSRQHHKRLHDCLVVSLDEHRSQVNQLSLQSLESNSIRLDRMHGQVGRISQNLLFFNGGRQNPAEVKPVNVGFVGEIDDNQLKVKHAFDFEQTRSIISWRHGMSTMIDDKMIQVGGLSTSAPQPLIIWNLSSSKLGYSSVSLDQPKFDLLNRHSFGMDMRDESTLLLYGGLRSLGHAKDRPVDSQSVAMLWDLRSNEPIHLCGDLVECYNSNVHFISDNQFVKVGGVSCKTGSETSLIELVDLRFSGLLSQKRVDPPLDETKFTILTNSKSCKISDSVITVGGGGNYFTFGTCFTKFHLLYHCGA